MTRTLDTITRITPNNERAVQMFELVSFASEMTAFRRQSEHLRRKVIVCASGGALR